MTETRISQPMGWQIKKLGDLVEILDHLRVPVNSEEREKRKGTIPYYGANGQQGWIDDYLFDEPLILIAEDGGNFDDFHTRQIAYEIEGKSWVNNHAHILRANHENYLDFLFYSLAHKDIRKYIAGSTRSKLTQKELRAIEILTPEDKPEQARIAYVLDTIDEAIAKVEAVIAKLKQVRAGMLHDLLSYGLDENGQLRDPIAHPEQFKDSPLGRIPRDWDVMKLGEALSMQAGNILSSKHIAENGQYPVYGGNGIRGYTSTFTHEGLFALIGRQGALCGTIIVASGKFYATEHAVVVTPKEQMNVGWLASYLTAMNLNRFSESSAQPGLSVQKISHHRIKLPKFPEQEAIDLCLKGIDKKFASEVAEVQKYKYLKSGLQDDLLTGRVRVPETIREGAAGA